MRILDVSPRVVALRRGGSQVRIAAILGALAEGHDVRLFSQPRLHELRARGEEPRATAQPRPRGAAAPPEHVHRNPLAAAVSELGERTWATAPVLSGAALTATRPRRLRELARWADVVLVEFPWQLAAAARAAGAKPVVLMAHNLEVEKFAAYAQAAGVRGRALLAHVERIERRALARADLVIAVSSDDRRGLAARYGADPRRIVVAPNGADPKAIAPATPAARAAARRALGLPDRPVALYAGADVTPNRRGLDWVRAAARRTERWTFLVVGAVGGRPRREGNVVYTGWVEDFHAHLAAADASLVPIAHGGGTKVKLVESLAAGLPTVAFEHALAGTAARHDEHVLVTPPSAAELASALDLLGADPELAARLGAAARALAVEQHDWRASARAVEDALLDLTGGRRAAAARAPRRSAAPRG